MYQHFFILNSYVTVIYLRFIKKHLFSDGKKKENLEVVALALFKQENLSEKLTSELHLSEKLTFENLLKTKTITCWKVGKYLLISAGCFVKNNLHTTSGFKFFLSINKKIFDFKKTLLKYVFSVAINAFAWRCG